MVKKILILLTLVHLLASCQLYRNKFECPPGRGVPCASVSEIEGMIVETKEGPDLFVEEQSKKSGKRSKRPKNKNMEGIVWITRTVDDCGEVLEERCFKICQPCGECY